MRSLVRPVTSRCRLMTNMVNRPSEAVTLIHLLRIVVSRIVFGSEATSTAQVFTASSCNNFQMNVDISELLDEMRKTSCLTLLLDVMRIKATAS